MDTMEIEQVTTILLLILLLRRRKRRRYEACKRPIKKQRRGPLKRERLRWDYDELADAVFRANYRMSKEKFKILVSKVGPHHLGEVLDCTGLIFFGFEFNDLALGRYAQRGR